MAEPWIVVPAVAGSSPVDHPTTARGLRISDDDSRLALHRPTPIGRAKNSAGLDANFSQGIIAPVLSRSKSWLPIEFREQNDGFGQVLCQLYARGRGSKPARTNYKSNEIFPCAEPFALPGPHPQEPFAPIAELADEEFQHFGPRIAIGVSS
jgi:hypothetical protein